MKTIFIYWKEENFSQNTIWALDQKGKQGLSNWNGHFVFVFYFFSPQKCKLLEFELRKNISAFTRSLFLAKFLFNSALICLINNQENKLTWNYKQKTKQCIYEPQWTSLEELTSEGAKAPAQMQHAQRSRLWRPFYSEFAVTFI